MTLARIEIVVQRATVSDDDVTVGSGLTEQRCYRVTGLLGDQREQAGYGILARSGERRVVLGTLRRQRLG